MYRPVARPRRSATGSAVSAVESPDVGRHHRREGAPQRVWRQRCAVFEIGVSGAAGEVGAAGRQRGRHQDRRPELTFGEEHPTPAGVKRQIGAQCRDVGTGLVVAALGAESVDDGRGGGGDVDVEGGPGDRGTRRSGNVVGFADFRVPALDAFAVWPRFPPRLPPRWPNPFRISALRITTTYRVAIGGAGDLSRSRP